MERYRRGKGKKRLLGSHQKCWIWGRNAVLETLAAGRWEILDLYLAADLPVEQLQAAQALAADQGLAPAVEAADRLTQLCHSTEHQGYLARMTEFPYSTEADVLQAAVPSPLYVQLDAIQDPHNFGAIVRSAEVFGVDALFMEETGQVGVTSMVVRSSAGAVNRLPLVRVPRLEELAGRLHDRGIVLAAASEKAELCLADFDFNRPAAVVIGNEGGGIRPALRDACDARVCIPQHGRIGALNAAVAASVFFYEARRQRTAAGGGAQTGL